MDIRSFFGKAPVKKKTKPKSSNAPSSSSTSAAASSSSVRSPSSSSSHSKTVKRGNSGSTKTLSKRNQQQQQHNTSASSKRKRQQNAIVESDSDDDFVVKPKTTTTKTTKKDLTTTATTTTTKKRKTSNNSNTPVDPYEASTDEEKMKNAYDSDATTDEGVTTTPTTTTAVITKSSSSQRRETSSSPVVKRSSSRRKTTSRNASSKRKDEDDDDDDDDDDDEDDDFVMKDDDNNSDDDDEFLEPSSTPSPPAKKRRQSPKSKTPKKSTPPPPSSTTKKSPTPPSSASKPTTPTTSPPIPLHLATPLCLTTLTFVITGILPTISRDDLTDYIKSLGGRVTSAVSKKTTHLICGELLEDGRNFDQGSKYKKAKEVGSCEILKGEEEFYGVVKMMGKKRQAVAAAAAPKKVTNPYNPYKRTSMGSRSSVGSDCNNPYKQTSVGSGTASVRLSLDSASARVSMEGEGRRKDDGGGMLWADKYAPRRVEEILGNQENVRKLTSWISRWEQTHLSSRKTSPHNPRAALLSGPPGIGKTTTAHLVSRSLSRDTLEFNASDVRSAKALSTKLLDVTGSQTLCFKSSNATPQKKRVLIMDEVDGMGAGDRSGISSLISMIKSTKIPIICICNDRQSPKLKSLIPYCLDLRYRRPVKSVISRRVVAVAEREGFNVEANAAEAISESCGNDIRQVLNLLQMWSRRSDSRSLTYVDAKRRERAVSKDDILRVNIFDATKMIVEGARNDLYKRFDAYFVDYSFMGLNVHQNYPKVVTGRFQASKRDSDPNAEVKVLEDLVDATTAMSDFGVAEHYVRSGDQAWGLLPLCASLAVKTGSCAGGGQGGFLTGYPEFAGWLGKNSSRGKMTRLLTEFDRRMSYKISADKKDLRLFYLPVLRNKFSSMVFDESDGMENVIDLMDEYGLDRDDLFEHFDEFGLNDDKVKKFASLDSKKKAAFTRLYNKGVHKNQALMQQPGALTKSKKKKGGGSDEMKELDVVDDDNEVAEDDDDEDDDDDDAKEIEKLFKKSKGSTSKNGGGKKKAATRKKKR